MHWVLRNLADRVRNAFVKRSYVTSLSDNGRYPQVCVDAVNSTSMFRHFRRIRNYTAILEHVSPEQGVEYLRHVARRPELVAALPRFAANDRVGDPRMHGYPPHGAFSPTTLRYVKVLGDLLDRFGTLDGLSICEIGVGYGGQCRVIAEWSRPAAYCLVDIRQALGLAERFLDHFALSVPVEFRTLNTLPAREWDLVISNYALTELPREYQEAYMDRAVRRARRGYVTFNRINPPAFRSMDAAEIAAALHGAAIGPEEPLTHAGNCVITWGPRPG
ncbi:MAG: putative sugar O-methyltransferase [Planctomycetes bacterium]|nr:putative sugar O-methyltransferase [Planctomycetota bacterium]